MERDINWLDDMAGKVVFSDGEVAEAVSIFNPAAFNSIKMLRSSWFDHMRGGIYGTKCGNRAYWPAEDCPSAYDLDEHRWIPSANLVDGKVGGVTLQEYFSAYSDKSGQPIPVEAMIGGMARKAGIIVQIEMPDALFESVKGDPNYSSELQVMLERNQVRDYLDEDVSDLGITEAAFLMMDGTFLPLGEEQVESLRNDRQFMAELEAGAERGL